MNIFYAGTPEIAVSPLEAIASHFNICGVLTNPDRPAGRKGILKPSPVKEKALSLGLDVYQPEVIDADFISQIESLKPDILVTFAYGKIFRKEFLSIFSKESINIHPSLLPRHRGPSPVNAAILAGDSETGISIQKMALKMDSGDIITQIRFPLDSSATLQSMSEFISEKSSEMIIPVISDIISGKYSAVPQDEKYATYCGKVKKEDGLIDWNETSAGIERKFRAYTPWPGIYTFWKGKNLLITKCHIPMDAEKEYNLSDIRPGTVTGVDRKEGILIKTGDSLLAVTGIKPQSKNEMDFKSFLNGAADFKGSIVGDKNDELA